MTVQKRIVLIPAYQPRLTLIDSTSKLVAVGYTVVVIDDGSGPEYTQTFDQLDTNVHLLRHDGNRGKGAALKTGYDYIRKKFHDFVVITADADGQHRVEDIQKVANGYEQYHGMLLLGSRTFEAGDVPLRSKFGNVLTRKVFALIARQQLTDTQTGLRAFDESLIDFMIKVPGGRFEYEMNVLLECSRNGVSIVELPIQTVYENNNETSHFHAVKDSLSIYGQIIKFISVSLLSFCVDYIMFLLLFSLAESLGVVGGVVFANITARIISASFNFALNKRFVFENKGNVPKSALSYMVLACSILAGNTIMLTILTGVFDMAAYLAKIVTEITLCIISYFVQKNIIFTRTQERVR